MRGGSIIIWCLLLLQFLLGCGFASYREKVDIFQGSRVRSVLVLPFINYSGVVNADTEVNNIFVAEFKKHSPGRVLGRRDVDNYLKKRGLKKKPLFDRKMSLTIGRLFKVDAVIYGTILSYMSPAVKIGSDRYTSLSMNVRVIDVRSGRITKAYALSKDVTPSPFTGVKKKFQITLNDSISDIVSDILKGDENLK